MTLREAGICANDLLYARVFDENDDAALLVHAATESDLFAYTTQGSPSEPRQVETGFEGTLLVGGGYQRPEEEGDDCVILASVAAPTVQDPEDDAVQASSDDAAIQASTDDAPAVLSTDEAPAVPDSEEEAADAREAPAVEDLTEDVDDAAAVNGVVAPTSPTYMASVCLETKI